MKIIIATLLLFSVFVQDSEELGTGGLPRAKPKPTTKGEFKRTAGKICAAAAILNCEGMNLEDWRGPQEKVARNI